PPRRRRGRSGGGRCAGPPTPVPRGRPRRSGAGPAAAPRRGRDRCRRTRRRGRGGRSTPPWGARRSRRRSLRSGSRPAILRAKKWRAVAMEAAAGRSLACPVVPAATLAPPDTAAEDAPGGRRWRRSAAVEHAVVSVLTLALSWPFLRRTPYVTGFDTVAYSGPNLNVLLDAWRHLRLALCHGQISPGPPNI